MGAPGRSHLLSLGLGSGGSGHKVGNNVSKWSNRWARFILSALLVVSFGLTLACGKGGSGSSTPNNPTPPTAAQPDITITIPTSYQGFASSSTAVALGGIANNVTEVNWANNRGGSGTASGTSTWSVASVPLQSGDNIITVTGVGGAGTTNATATITVTANSNGIQFLGVPTALPDGLFLNEPNTIIIRTQLSPNAQIDPATIHLLQLNADQTTTDLGAMYDDGNIAHGDEIQSDGVYSGMFTLTGTKVSTMNFRVVGKTISDPTASAYSVVLTIPVEEHLTSQQLTDAAQMTTSAESKFQALLASNPRATALSMTSDWLKQQSTVLDAGSSDNGVWWLNNSGVLGGYCDTDGQQVRSGADRKHAPVGEARLSALDSGVFKAHAPAKLAAQADTEYIGSKAAKVMAAYFTQFEGWGGDEAEEINGWLQNSVCPKFDVAPFLKDGDVTVNEFKNLSNYGVIVITSHGDTWYKGLLSLWQQKWKWNYIGGQVVILTHETATDANKATYEMDLKMGRLAITNGGTYAVLPSFIKYYNGSFPGSIVYAGSCRSRYNASMSNAFLGNGAKTYLGYTDYVDSPFACSTGKNFFDKMINSGHKTGTAFVSGLNDGKAWFVMDGSQNLSMQPTDLLNGNFELGNLNGWSRTGDGRVITQLGSTLPTQSTYMAIISTGLGFTIDSGSISQPLCVPALPAGMTKIKLKYKWNFFSEEFMEFVGSVYQDYLDVSMGGTSWQHDTIDSLASSVTVSDVSFDRGGVYNTGWRTADIDITSLAGQGVVLTFAAGDVGDSIYDTAVLIDDIQITFE